MILNFRDRVTEDIFNGIDSKAARTLPKTVWNIAARKLDLLNATHELRDLRIPPGNRLESLKGPWKGCHSIRINDQWKLVFRWNDGNANDVLITDYHS